MLISTDEQTGSRGWGYRCFDHPAVLGMLRRRILAADQVRGLHSPLDTTPEFDELLLVLQPMAPRAVVRVLGVVIRCEVCGGGVDAIPLLADQPCLSNIVLSL